MQYLKKAGLGPKSLRGVIPLDGACYDVPRQIAEGGDFMRDTYMQAFGSEKERQLRPFADASCRRAECARLSHPACAAHRWHRAIQALGEA
jgi:arylformamidase